MSGGTPDRAGRDDKVASKGPAAHSLSVASFPSEPVCPRTQWRSVHCEWRSEIPLIVVWVNLRIAQRSTWHQVNTTAGRGDGSYHPTRAHGEAHGPGPP